MDRIKCLLLIAIFVVTSVFYGYGGWLVYSSVSVIHSSGYYVIGVGERICGDAFCAYYYSGLLQRDGFGRGKILITKAQVFGSPIIIVASVPYEIGECNATITQAFDDFCVVHIGKHKELYFNYIDLIAGIASIVAGACFCVLSLKILAEVW